MKIIAVHQTPKNPVGFILAWGIKAYQLLAPWSSGFMRWNKAKYNHLAVLDDQALQIYELDGKYKQWRIEEFPYKYETCTKSGQWAYHQQIQNLKMYKERKYKWLWNITVLPIIGKLVAAWLQPGNCVWFACSVTGLAGDKEWSELPCDFL